MRCCTFGSGCAACTTNLRKRGNEYEKEVVFHCTAGDSGDGAIRFPWRRSRDAALELVSAAVDRMAADHVLAGIWDSGALPHFVWRVGQPRQKRAWRISNQRADGRTNG